MTATRQGIPETHTRPAGGALLRSASDVPKPKGYAPAGSFATRHGSCDTHDAAAGGVLLRGGPGLETRLKRGSTTARPSVRSAIRDALPNGQSPAGPLATRQGIPETHTRPAGGALLRSATVVAKPKTDPPTGPLDTRHAICETQANAAGEPAAAEDIF